MKIHSSKHYFEHFCMKALCKIGVMFPISTSLEKNPLQSYSRNSIAQQTRFKKKKDQVSQLLDLMNDVVDLTQVERNFTHRAK